MELLLVGCATGYHPSGLTGGYSEIQLNERSYEVTFSGNGYTHREAARQGAIHRAAELTLQRGFYGFWVGGQENSVRTSVYSEPVNCSTIGTSTSCTGGNTQLINKPDSTMTIGMVTWDEFQRAPPGTIVYDARLILSQVSY